MNTTEFLWVEKYRPPTIDDTILPKAIHDTLVGFLKAGDLPNLLFSGPPGIGKTTAAKAMLETLGVDYIVVNGSMNGNIDTLRNEILTFASSVSFMTGKRKYVILDEADYLNAVSTQPALRNFMEQYSVNCGFILTANYKNKIIPALRSRCTEVDFAFTADDKVAMATAFFKRAQSILNNENVKFDKKVLAEVISKHMPDWRRALNELQGYAVNGSIDAGILANLNEISLFDLMVLMKAKNYTDIVKWVYENIHNDHNTLFRALFEEAKKYVTKESIPLMVLIIGKYDYQMAFAVNHDITLICCLTEIMLECEFL
jgi:DNA polymerase III delta prime subunit